MFAAPINGGVRPQMQGDKHPMMQGGQPPMGMRPMRGRYELSVQDAELIIHGYRQRQMDAWAPEDSYQRMVEHLAGLLPNATEKQIKKLLK